MTSTSYFYPCQVSGPILNQLLQYLLVFKTPPLCAFHYSFKLYSVLDFLGTGMIPTTVNKIVDTNHGWEPKYLQFPTNRVSLIQLTKHLRSQPEDKKVWIIKERGYVLTRFIHRLYYSYKVVAQLKKRKILRIDNKSQIYSRTLSGT